MKKIILGLATLGLLASIAVPVNKNFARVEADGDYVVYKNADLGLEDYGDTYVFNGDGTYDYYIGDELSVKSELHLRYRNSRVGENSNYWISVGGYAVYVSASSTIRFLYLTDNNSAPGTANRFSRNAPLSGLIMKAEDGTLLTDLMPNNKIFDDFIDATYKFDLSGTYGMVEFSIEYNDKTFYPYNGNTKIASYSFSVAPVNISDYKFRMATADGLSGKIITFDKQEGEYIPNSFVNNGEFTYSGGTLISASKCSAQGVPTGNVGSVLKVTGTQNNNVVFDFSSGNFKLSDIHSVVFRIYANATVSGDYPEFRLKMKNGNWAFNGTGDFAGAGGYSLKTVAGQWYDVVVSPNYFINSASWNDFSDDGHILGNMEVFLRCSSTSDVFYFDSVTVHTTSTAEFTHNNQFEVTPLAGTSFDFPVNPSYASIPTGASGPVLVLTGTSDDKFTIDFTASEIPVALVNSIDFKVYAAATANNKYPEFRLQNPDYSARGLDMWPYTNNGGGGGYSLIDNLNNWRIMSVNSTTITGSHKWDNFVDADDPTILGLFNVHFRTNTTSDTLYIDSITLDLKANDGVGPVITCPYNSMTIPAGSVIDLKASAFDAQDNRNIVVDYEWDPNMTFDGSGAVTSKGTFLVNATATDYFGNKSTHVVTVTVGDEDTDAPIINVPYNSVTLPAGVEFNFDASKYIADAYEFTYNVTYSNGTMDELNRLLVGTHAMTITAEDLSGNESSKVITLNVVNDFSPSGSVIDEQYLDDYDVVYQFSVTYLKMGTISTSNVEDTGACLSYYDDAKDAFDALTDEQKEIFLTNSDFADMVARLSAWAVANNETFNPSTGSFSLSINAFDNDYNGITIITAVVSLITVLGIALILIKKRRTI